MDSTGGVSSMWKEDEEGATLLARMVPPGGNLSMRKEDEEGALLARMITAGGEPLMLKEDVEGALLARMVPAGGDLSMRKEDEEESMEERALRWKKDMEEAAMRSTLMCFFLGDVIHSDKTPEEIYELLREYYKSSSEYQTALQARQAALPKKPGKPMSSEEAMRKATEMEANKTNAKDEEAWKAKVSVKEAQEGALLVGMDSTGGKSLTWKEAEVAEEIRQIEMQRQAEVDMIDFFIRSLPQERFLRALEQYSVMKCEAASCRALVASREKLKPLLASREKSVRREKVKANEEAESSVTDVWRPEESVTESGRPEESMADAGKAEEAVAEAGNRQKVMGKETLQQLLEDMPNNFDTLDPDGDDEKDGREMAKSSIEEEHMPSGWNNPSDRGEVSVTVGRGKSVSPETEDSVIEAEEALKEAEGALLVGMDSTGGVSSVGNQAQAGTALLPWIDPAGGAPSMRKEDEEYSGMISGERRWLQIPGLMSEVKRLREVHTISGLLSIKPRELWEKDLKEGALLDIQKKWAKKNNNLDKENLGQMVIDSSDKLYIPMRSSSAIDGYTSIVELDKLLLQPADPSACSSVTRLEVQDDLHHDRGKSSAMKTADEEMAYEAKNFAKYRRYWESVWGKTCGSFEYMTALSSMQFTYYTPGRRQHNDAANTPATLQIFSIKLTGIADDLQWPLSVYGVVAIRDVVDHNRNFLFSCDRDESQELTPNDPFLHLIGPSRAVVFEDMVDIEIQLKVEDPTGSQDKPLITEARRYNETFNDVSTVCFKNCFCTIEMCMQVVRKTIQATILGVRVVGDGPWPFKYGARVTCSPVPGKPGFPNNPVSEEIVMVDSKDREMLYGSDGYLHLARNVISVETEGRLDVHILAYSKSGKMSAQKHVRLVPRYSKISQRHCFVRGAEVVITVAWSLVATDKDTFMALGELACVS